MPSRLFPCLCTWQSRRQGATSASIGPSFNWKILNYGRIANNVLLQDNRFDQALVNYRNVALTAQREVEDGIIDFLRFHDQLKHQEISAKAAARTAELGRFRYEAGKIAFNSVFVYEADLVSKQDSLIQTRANAALALINTYKALGGGWQIRQREPYDGVNRGVPSPVAFQQTDLEEVPALEAPDSLPDEDDPAQELTIAQ
ncbi:TolC family protein [Fuerstiella marisgermanici]|uniref:Outer membrane protein OprM n=1 Tax=Fuerstiella marisgermanici TaxID=1891926 RepID=A0A1P8WBY6_9PLAN|nr:TolC family protein [Fuerstiella marisgermanici]APZ91577.1 Outer membrane protein OprM precursor [Fuerstiella marisgermanici]